MTTKMTDEHIARCIARLRAEPAGRTREGRELAAALVAALARRAEAQVYKSGSNSIESPSGGTTT